MTLSALLNRKITIIRRSASGSQDGYGDETASATTIQTTGELQQRSRTEAEQVIGVGEWLLILPAGTPLDTNDVVQVDGDSYEVTGPPWEARNPRTRQAQHIEASLRRTAGAP